MLKTRFAKLAPLLVLAVLFVFCGCSAAPHIQVKAAGPVMNTTIPTTVSSSPITPVGSVPGIPPVDLSNWKITQDQAIDTACQYIPTGITSQATISAGMEAYGNLKTGEISYYWTVYFENISVTQAELGWQSDSQTTLNPGPDGNYTEIIIRIDAVNGNYVSRTAMLALPQFEVPSTSIYPSNGQTNVPINDVTFTWPAVAGTGVTYQFALAQATANSPSNEFAVVDYSDNTITNAEPSQETLQYNTVYWWEIRAVYLDSSGSVTSYGLWSIQTFTTIAGPPTTPIHFQTTVVTTNPTTVAPTQTNIIFPTPPGLYTHTSTSYTFWAIIVICAVLVIVAIFLIVRIRRRR